MMNRTPKKWLADFTPDKADKPDGPEASPDILAPPPKRGEGVRRLNKKPVLIAASMVGASLLVLFYSMGERSKEQRQPADPAAAAKANDSDKPMAVSDPPVLDKAPKAGLVPAGDGLGDFMQTAVNSEAAPGLEIADGGGAPVVGGQTVPALQGGPAPAVYQSPYEAQWRQYDQVQAAQRQARFERANMAYSADSAIDVSKARAGGATGGSPSGVPAGLLAQAVSGAGAAASSPIADPSGQSQRRAFANNGAAAASYSSARIQAPLSQTELKAGTVIPAVLISGVNSDLPGQLVAQVTRNVFDTATGRYLLVPQGAKLVGEYSSDVAYGQARVQVAWKRLILPDGSSFDLGKSPGMDRSGYAGFRDKVNNHYGRAYGSALMVSLFSAGIQLSQPQAANGENISPGQTAAAAIGQEMGQLGMEQARRNLNIQPELRIRPGYRFNVAVTEDLILKEWRAR